jgi:hypothetical protein
VSSSCEMAISASATASFTVADNFIERHCLQHLSRLIYGIRRFTDHVVMRRHLRSGEVACVVPWRGSGGTGHMGLTAEVSDKIGGLP